MASNFLHGVETIWSDQGPSAVRIVKSAIVAVIGSAPAGPVNTPVLVKNERDWAAFGDGRCGTLVPALQAIFKQKPTLCVAINVLDRTVANAAFGIGAILTTKKYKLDCPEEQFGYPAYFFDVQLKNADNTITYEAGVDFIFHEATQTLELLSLNASPAAPLSVNVTAKVADLDAVTAAHIIGGSAAGVRTGAQLLRECYQRFGYFAKVIIAPGFTGDAGVVTELTAVAEATRAMVLADVPLGADVQTAIEGRGPAGSINLQSASRRVVYCYPHVVNSAGKTEPLSAYAAGALTRKDQENGYWWSPSNTPINGIVGLTEPLAAMINDPLSDVNLLNEAGITTVLNSYGTSLRLWGNRSAAWPSDTDPRNFICGQRVADIIAESLEYFSLPFVDRPINNALIEAIVERGNGFMRKLAGDGAVLDGRVWFDPGRNPKEQLATGQIIFSYDFMFPPPGERISYEANINLNYLSALGTEAA